MIKIIAVILLVMCITISVCTAGDVSVSGNITEYTTTTDGLMLMVDGGTPGNCTGTPFGWLLIPEKNKTMIAMALASLTTGHKYVTLYTEGFTSTSVFCVIIQVQPSGF